MKLETETVTTRNALFDSHCHLDFDDFKADRSSTLKLCQQAGIRHICIPGISERNWNKLLQLTATPDLPVNLYPALGLHPYYLDEHKEYHLDTLSQLLMERREEISAIGEIGLDYALTNTNKEKQAFFFEQQLDLAQQYQLPVIIHARKSHDQVLKQLRKRRLESAGIIHAFSGSQQQAEQYIELGFKLGFGGGITYERASKTRKLAASLPLEAIVLETDSPDMPLYGFQGERNSPVQLVLIARTMAELRDIEVSTLINRTTQNSFDILPNARGG